MYVFGCHLHSGRAQGKALRSLSWCPSLLPTPATYTHRHMHAHLHVLVNDEGDQEACGHPPGARESMGEGDVPHSPGDLYAVLPGRAPTALPSVGHDHILSESRSSSQSSAKDSCLLTHPLL